MSHRLNDTMVDRGCPHHIRNERHQPVAATGTDHALFSTEFAQDFAALFRSQILVTFYLVRFWECREIKHKETIYITPYFLPFQSVARRALFSGNTG